MLNLCKCLNYLKKQKKKISVLPLVKLFTPIVELNNFVFGGGPLSAQSFNVSL